MVNGANLNLWLTMVVFLVTLVGTATGETIYVDADAPGPAHNGSSWTHAYKYLQDAFAVAQYGDEIRVAEGIYTPDSNSVEPNGAGNRDATFQLINGVAVCGGYAGFGEPDPNARDVELYETTLSGDLDGNDVDVNDSRAENSYHVITGNGTDETAVLDGFTIRGGNADGIAPEDCGGGMRNTDPNPIVTNCTFSGNIGGGMRNDSGSTPIVTNCIFWGNTRGSFDGSSSPIVTFSDVEGGFLGTGNIDADPCFIDAGYWDNNDTPGDPNDDIWVDGDYHLKSQAGRWDPNSESWVTDANTSPCIDAGNPGCPVGSEPMPNGDRINMGVYGGTPTASKSPADWRSIADLTNDWAVDFNDLAVFVDYWLGAGQCVPSDLNRSESVNFADYAIFADNWRVE